MTATNGPVLFNATTGSDTQASGLGPATAEYGSGASITSGSAVVTGITTTGVTAGDLLWVQSSTGRQYSIIASVDSGTQVTCDDTFGATEASRTWAIGGKRATLDGTLELFSDALGTSHVVELETDQTLSSTIRWLEASTVAKMTMRSSVAGTKRTITQTSDSTPIIAQDTTWNTPQHIVFQDIKFLNTASVKDNCVEHDNTGHAVVTFYRCQIGDSGQGFTAGLRNANYSGAQAIESVFIDCDDAIRLTSTQRELNIDGCYFKNCTRGIQGRYHKPDIRNSVFDSCTTYAVQFELNEGKKAWASHNFANTVFYNNGTAIDFTRNDSRSLLIFKDVIFEANTTAIDGPSGMEINLDRCGFYNNTTDISAGVTAEQYSQLSLSASPFVDAANGDFNVSDSVGGGSVLRASNIDFNNSTSFFSFRNFVSDNFGGGGNVIVIED